MSEQPFQDDIRTMIGTMNRVTDISQRERIIEQEIQLASKKEEMKAKLRSLYLSQNISVSDSVIEEAIQKELDARFDPPPPPSSFHSWLAGLWIHRMRWMAAAISLAIISAALTAAVQRSIHTRKQAEMTRQQQALGDSVREASAATASFSLAVKQQTLLHERYEELRHQIPIWSSSIIPVCQRKLLDAQTSAQSIDAAFDQAAAPLQTLERTLAKAEFKDLDILRENAGLLKKMTSALEAKTQAAFTELQAITAIDLTEKRLQGVLANSKLVPPPLLESKKAAAYAALSEGNLPQTETIIESLQAANIQAAREAETSHALRFIIDRLKNQPVQDSSARHASQTAISQCQEALENPQNARGALLFANETYRKIDQEFELHVVSRNQTAFKRTFSNSGGKAKSIAYVVVETRDDQGRAVKFPIVNAENGRTETVSLWAEEVPDEVWNKIAADKRADGIVDDHLFGSKKKGSLEIQYGKIPSSTRRITHW